MIKDLGIKFESKCYGLGAGGRGPFRLERKRQKKSRRALVLIWGVEWQRSDAPAPVAAAEQQVA